ncbi:MAG: RNA polymerase sigma-70 factor [Pedobacter sp.]|nr:MAG: RNA polymerase sigma-70 factor [Pedobacter sp.]
MTPYSIHTDDELAALLRQGDQAAYTEIFTRYNKVLYSHVYNKLRLKEEAYDIVHDVFYALWAKREQNTPNSNLIGYLFKAVRYKVADFLSHKQVEDKYVTSLQSFINEQPAYTDYKVREQQLKDIIEQEISALPERMQLIFRMSRYEEKTHRQIAEELNLSEETVKDQVKKALRILRVKLGLFVFLCVYFKFL